MQTLQDHYGEAMAAQGRGDSTAAALHNGVVTAAIGGHSPNLNDCFLAIPDPLS